MLMSPDIITIHENKLKTGETLGDLVIEIDEYWKVLLGEAQPPYDKGILTLMEYAQDVYARAMFISYLILQMEREGIVEKKSPLYSFRTGELRTFIEVAKASTELGSRRLTKAKMEQEMIHDGNE